MRSSSDGIGSHGFVSDWELSPDRRGRFIEEWPETPNKRFGHIPVVEVDSKCIHALLDETGDERSGAGGVR
jgi:hypothetical protein